MNFSFLEIQCFLKFSWLHHSEKKFYELASLVAVLYNNVGRFLEPLIPLTILSASFDISASFIVVVASFSAETWLICMMIVLNQFS